MKYDYIVAVDPDSRKSGLAIINVNEKELVAAVSLPFQELIEFIKDWKPVMGACAIYVEASWLNGRHNWHNKAGDRRAVSNAKGYDVGRCHQTGMLIVESLKHYGIDVIECQPLKKCWKGPEGKITHEELAHFVPNLPKRTNSEVRDATLICWYYAGLPISTLKTVTK